MLCVNGLLTKWSKGWNEVNGSCKHNVDILSSVMDRSEIPSGPDVNWTGISQAIQVTGNQKRPGAAVVFSLSWLQAVCWETLIRGLQFSCSAACVFSGSRHRQSALCVFCLGGKSELSVCVWDFFLLVSFYPFCFPPWSVTLTSPCFFFSVQWFLFI